MKMPYQECPSFIRCSAPKCPLDPERDQRISYPNEEKCRANKPTREKIGKKYPNLLPYQGLTSREWLGRKRWQALILEQREKITTQGAKQLKSLRTGVLKGVAILFCFFTFNLAWAEMNLTRAVIHHTASPDVSAETIDRWHKERGWDSIGYHFVIRQNGTVEKGRPLTQPGAHAKGRNHYVGIALTGYDDFTQAQLQSLTNLLNSLDIEQIEVHHEQCPGEKFWAMFDKKFLTRR